MESGKTRSSPEVRPYLTQSGLNVVFQKSTPPQIRQLILYYYQYKEQVGIFVWELTFATDSENTLREISPEWY